MESSDSMDVSEVNLIANPPPPFRPLAANKLVSSHDPSKSPLPPTFDFPSNGRPLNVQNRENLNLQPLVLRTMAPKNSAPPVLRHYALDFAHCCTQGLRETLEDAYDMREDSQYVFLAVYDGHDGKDVAEYLARNFYTFFSESPYDSIEKKFLNVSERCDKGVLEKKLIGGSTAAIVVLEKKTGLMHAYNVGDSEIVVVNNNDREWELLSVLHRPDASIEIDRVKKLKQGRLLTFEKNRVNGKEEMRLCGYGVSRAFGDHFYGKMPTLPVDVLTSVGSYRSKDHISGGYTLIVHCDGLTENLAHKKVVELVKVTDPGATALDVCHKLVQAALDSKSTDNISVVVAKIKPVFDGTPSPTLQNANDSALLVPLPQNAPTMTIPMSNSSTSVINTRTRPASPARGNAGSKTPRKKDIRQTAVTNAAQLSVSQAGAAPPVANGAVPVVPFALPLFLEEGSASPVRLTGGTTTAPMVAPVLLPTPGIAAVPQMLAVDPTDSPSASPSRRSARLKQSTPNSTPTR